MSKASRKKPKEEKQRVGPSAVIIDPKVKSKLMSDASKGRVITANDLSKKYNIKVGVVKELLRSLEEKGTIKPVIKTRVLEVYTSSSVKKEEKPQE